MTPEGRAPRREYYGLAEIADALGLARQLVTVWRRRRSHGIPDPTCELASGPIWRGAEIEPWIDRMRTERSAGDVEPLTPDLALRLARRTLRLLALVLEPNPRPQLLAQAVAAVRDLRPGVEATGPDEPGRLARTVLAATGPATDGGPDAVRRRLVEALPAIAELITTANSGSADEIPPSG
ncbi:hypothetical protein [Amycolatopsis sp. PS_44_ISF1]|uniref:helix-turn-helix transcriptional regulator n=1 Tax=Amycolatopsis sp. PS_44_ISF1 TaxID=2974917 RepID=UPI0028DE3FE9|nr:hypothetical protein [Amycolatopsis sp. PS_44_ISF1]MDT8912340.1 hypothetical protein [Amycolatopsis sp. PS_44_ISF1]